MYPINQTNLISSTQIQQTVWKNTKYTENLRPIVVTGNGTCGKFS